MKKLFKNAKTPLMIAASLAFALQTNAAHAQDWDRRDFLKAELISFEQVPSVLAPSHGNFEAQINEDGTISFELSYANMSSAVTQAHIHFGASKTNGGVVVFYSYAVALSRPAQLRER
jgi:hypothetical protein